MWKDDQQLTPVQSLLCTYKITHTHRPYKHQKKMNGSVANIIKLDLPVTEISHTKTSSIGKTNHWNHQQ